MVYNLLVAVFGAVLLLLIWGGITLWGRGSSSEPASGMECDEESVECSACGARRTCILPGKTV